MSFSSLKAQDSDVESLISASSDDLDFLGKETQSKEDEADESLYEELNNLFRTNEEPVSRASEKATNFQLPRREVPQHLKEIIEICEVSLV